MDVAHRSGLTAHVTSASRPRSGSSLELALLAGFALLAPALGGRVLLRPSDPLDGVAVVFAPWVSAAEAASRATAPGARLIGFGALPSIVIVRPDDPAYTARVLSDGALLALDPGLLATCGGAVRRAPS